MEERKFQNKKRYILAFVIATIIFGLVFLASYTISYIELQRVSSLQTNLAYDIFSHKLDYSLFNKKICYYNSYEQITNDLNFQRGIIGDLEKRLGRDNNAVIERKKFYSLVELEHMEFVQKLNNECNQGINIILFFYSNNEKDLEASESVGKILDTVSSKNREDLIIYSFDINLNSSLITNLKEQYNIDTSPIVIVKDKKLVHPKNIDEIENYLT